MKDVSRVRGLVRQARELRRQQRDHEVLRPVGKVGLRLPAEHASLLVERCLVVVQRRWTFGVPAVLVLPHPLDAHRQADFLRDECRVGSSVLVPVAPIAAGALDIDAADVLGFHREHVRELFAQQVGLLRRAPNSQLVVDVLGYRA